MIMEDLLGPVQGRWLEFFLLPLSLSVTLASGALALWTGLAGHAQAYPWPLLLAYFWFAPMAGSFITCLQRTKRTEEVGRGFEAVLIGGLPLLWQLVPLAFGRKGIEMLPVMGTGSGFPSMLLVTVLGLSVWGVSLILGDGISSLWPSADNMRRVKWLPTSNADKSDEELGEMAAREAKARIMKAEESSGTFTMFLLSLSGLLLLLAFLRPESGMDAGTAFVLWSIIQAVTGLVSIAGFNYSLKRIGWTLHKARIEPGIGQIWITAVLILALAAFSGGWGVHTGVTRVREHFAPATQKTEQQVEERKRTGSERTSEAVRTVREKDEKAQSKAPARKKLETGKAKKTPTAVRTIWGLILGIVIGGVLVTTVLVTLCMVVLLLLALIQLIPGMGGVLGAGKGLFGTGGKGIAEALAWPFLAVGELVRHGGREILKALKSGIGGFGRDSLPARLARSGGGSARHSLGRMLRGRRAKRILREGGANERVRFHYHQFLLDLERKGVRRGPVETPMEIGKRVVERVGPDERVESLTEAFQSARYSKGEVKADMATRAAQWARDIIKRFKKGS